MGRSVCEVPSWTNVTFSQGEEHMFLQGKESIHIEFQKDGPLICNVFKGFCS